MTSKLKLLALLPGLALVAPACEGSRAAAPPPPTPGAAVPKPAPPAHIIGPTETPRIPTAAQDGAGKPATVACSTCHTIKPADTRRRQGASLKVFHQGLTMRHGNLTCVSCHDARDYDRLRLADGTPVPFPEVMRLCRQCHGPQARNYDHGAHGGMNGPWDRTKGPRTRNGCTVCHDPHAPAYPRVRPAAPPADRGTVAMKEAERGSHGKHAAPAPTATKPAKPAPAQGQETKAHD